MGHIEGFLISLTQVLSAPQRGWKYPVIPIDQKQHGSTTNNKVESTGIVLALHDGTEIQHKVLVPITGNENEVRILAV